MRVIYNPSTDPFFNLAAEEYLALNYTEDIFMLWQNSRAVIIGKNQNLLSEVNTDLTKREGIPVLRRITGGGAVFHDMGNINYTFITEHDGKIDFERFASPVISALKEMGIDAVLGGRNDIMAQGFKISGNAQCRVKTKNGFSVLHHGTLLFSADLSLLSGALKPQKLKLSSKGIKSVLSRVKNISELEGYCGPKAADDFMKELFSLTALGKTGSLSPEETEEISELSDKKYRTWEWSCGEDPAFQITNTERFPFGTLTVHINCKSSKIEKIKFEGDFFGDGGFAVEKLLEDVPFDKEHIKARLQNAPFDIGGCIFGADVDSLCKLILSQKSDS